MHQSEPDIYIGFSPALHLQEKSKKNGGVFLCFGDPASLNWSLHQPFQKGYSANKKKTAKNNITCLINFTIKCLIKFTIKFSDSQVLIKYESGFVITKIKLSM